MPPNLVHATVVHTRYDIRILFKQCASLSGDGVGFVSLLVADGKGDETWNGVRIHDVGQAPLGRVGRAVTGTFRMWRAIRKARPDLVQIHDPELLPLAIVLNASGTRVLFDMHENLPRQILTKTWIAPKARRLVGSIARAAQAVAARRIPTIFAEESYTRDFPSAVRSVVVLNYPLVDSLTTIVREKRTRFTVGYIGGLSEERGAPIVVKAIARLRQEGMDIGGVLIGPVAAGPAVADMLATADREGWLTVPGRLKPEIGWSLLAECHVGVAILQPLSNFVESYPTKLFEYMALGLPVVVSDFPLWREVVGKSGCGLLVDPTDVDALAAALRWIFEHPNEAAQMGRNGRGAVLEKYRWESEFKKLKDFYAEVLDRAPEGASS
jgi:glycosyltransferase involved in cell wall biosynthesis